MAQQKRYRRRRRRRNSHYGVLFLIILALLLAIFGVVKLFNGIFFNDSNKIAVYQMGNVNAIYKGKLYQPDEDVAAALINGENGAIMIPVRMLNQTLGIKTQWVSDTKTIELKFKRTQVQMQIGNTSMSVGEEQRTLRAAPVLEGGTSYVPLQDMADAFSWQVQETDALSGEYIIVFKSDKELTEKLVAKATQQAQQKLGPSTQQLMSESVLFSVNTAKVVKDGVLTTLKTSDGKNAAVTTQDEQAMLSFEALVSLFGGTSTYDEKKGWSATVGENEIQVTKKGQLKRNGKKVSSSGVTVSLSETDNTVMISPEAAAEIASYYYTSLEDGLFALTAQPLAAFPMQLEFVQASAQQLKTSQSLASIPAADNYIALTFDDGPTGATEDYSEGLTVHLLDELKARDVYATFMICGYRLEQFNSHATRYLAEGHELGNHTVNHVMSDLSTLSEAELRSEIEDNSTLIQQYCGAKPTVFRPVGGHINDIVVQIATEQGVPIINWDVNSLDWQNKTDAEAVKANILDAVQDGSIVLLHDLYSGTIEGVLQAIDELNAREETYAFVTVSQLAEIKGITLEPGVEYKNIVEPTDNEISAA